MPRPGRELVQARTRRRDIEQIVRRKGADALDLEGLLDLAQAIRCILAADPRRRDAVAFNDVRERLQMWCQKHEPVFGPDQIGSVARAAMRSRNPFIDKADAVAERFGLTYAERTAWGITTIGAVDADKKERKRLRKERKRERDRLRTAERRRAQGALRREEYLARSLARAKPWQAAGMSRAAWYRHRKVAGETSASPPNIYEGSDGPVSPGSASPQEGTGNGRGRVTGSALHSPRSAAFDRGEVASLGRDRKKRRADKKSRPRAPCSRRTKNLGGTGTRRPRGAAEICSAVMH
jgi:hypothetical protein